MYPSTERKWRTSAQSITKFIPYEEYLQLKNVYINLKEKNKKIKQEKQKLESILKEYQLHLTDYKSSNNTIKILFQKVENNYKQLNIVQKNSFKNIFKIRADNFKIVNENNSLKLKSKKNTSYNYSSNEQQETFKKTINNLRSNNEIINKEYNEAIDRYIDVINQLKREIKIKDELFKIKDNKINNQKNYNLNNDFKNLDIAYNAINFNIIKEKVKLKNKNLKNKSGKLIISSNISEFNIIQKNNKNSLENKFKTHFFELNILNGNINFKKFSDNLEISYNVSKINILNENKNCKKFSDKLDISYSVCKLFILKENTDNKKINDFFDKLDISSNICEFYILKENNKLINDNKLTLSISSNIGELNIIKEKPNLINNELSIISKISEINIIQANKQKIFFEESILNCSNIIEINLLSKQSKKISTNMNIISNSFEMIIPSTTSIKEKNEKLSISIFKNLMICQDINEINILCDKKSSIVLNIISKINEINIIPDENKRRSLYLDKLSIESQINDINIFSDEKIKRLLFLKNITISSKINNINLMPKDKNNILDISGNVSELTIIQKKKFEEKLFKIDNEFFIISRTKNKLRDKHIKTEKIMFENYINSLNLGFDSRKKYKNYNIINKEKAEDSDDENDRLECEPIPSFLLCIEKMKKVKEDL